MASQPNGLFITYVEKEGPFLKVWGQTNKKTSLYVEQVLHSFTTQFDNGLGIPHPETLQIGVLCCAKYKDNKYYRAKITSLNYLLNRYVEVNFVDYGNKDAVPINNVRSLEGFESAFISIPPQASCFLLAEAVSCRGEWNETYLDEISKEIRYKEANFSIIAQVARHYLVRLFVGINDLAIILISKGLMRHTSLTTQEAVLLSMMPRTGPGVGPQQPVPQQNIATYKAFTLEPGSQYEVYVSYVTDGPCNFSVQLKQSEEVLGKLMKEINSMTLTPVEGIPIPGAVCLARCLEDGHICRAVVTNEVDGQFKVFYVDFGNFEVVSLESLYDIPFKYVIPKVMAIRFALAGIEKSTVTLEMLCAFKQFVDNRLIHMKVMPMTARTALPRCELWDPETQISALDIVNQAASTSYPDHISLNRGFSQPIKVSYVCSCNRFYVQLTQKQDDLMRLMLDIQTLSQDADTVSPNSIKVGLPCYAQFALDGQWYRCQVVEVLPAARVKIHYVDYGNEAVVEADSLKAIEGKHLTVLRPQAIECCLNGYQNMEPDQERDTLLEELILEQEFTMKVVEMQAKKALIELIDSANYNVASLLLDKIAVTRSQVSPMLVQAGNKIEHRRSIPHHKERRRNTDSNETNELTSWRQNNKGFNKNDRNRREIDLNSSTDSDKPTNKGYRNKNDFNAKNSDNSWKQNRGFQVERDNSKEKDDWSNNDNENKNPRGRDNNWTSNRDDKKNFSPRNRDERFNNRGDNIKKNWPPKGNSDWEGAESATRNDDWNEEKKSDDNWNNKSQRKNDNWGNKENMNWGGGDNNDNWGNKDDRRKFRPRDDNFKKNQNRSDDSADWNSEAGHKAGGFKKRTDFRREASELSSSGSEKGSRKGFKKPPQAFNKKFGKSHDASHDSWNVSTSTVVEVPNPAPSTAKFKAINVDGTDANVIISWFHNPENFYCQLDNTQDEFKQMMQDIQEAYKNRTSSSAKVGAPVVGLFPEDGVLYRAEILEVLGTQFKIYYVDFGNVSVIDKVWPIEMKFMALPAQAICCKLSGIRAPADAWSEPNVYSPFFDKKLFVCKFLSTEGDKVAVTLESDNQDIATALLTEGLAESVFSLQEPELPLLIGQQFRAMLISMNGLDDFVMSLQSGVALKCAIFNLAASTETWENVLKEKLEQILIAYVDDLKEDRLEVTLYDETGAKIKLIDSDEGAYESVESICPYLVQFSTLSGEIVHVDGNTIYLQPSDCAENVEYLLNGLYESYESAPVENPLGPVDNFVYAVKSSDGNWYRGRVTSIGEDRASVTYLDYNNSEEVEFSALRELTGAFMDVQVLCLGVTVKEATDELIGKLVTIDLTFTDVGLEGTIREEPIQEREVEAAAVVPVQEDEVCATPEIKSFGTEVVLSHTDSPSDFYLQLGDSIQAINDLQVTLQEQISEMADIENPAIGVLCAAPYSLDQQWYRAHVLDADTDITTVRFVDFGNTDVLDNKTTHVKTLPANLLSLEVHATRCRLKIKPVDEEWSSAASERFEQLCGVASLTAQFISQDEKTNYVELYSDGVNIRDVLIDENLALPDKVLPDTRSLAFVSHLNSPSEFWIQLENCIEELELVAERLSGTETFAELEDLAPGTLCAALFPDDQMWYRARILSNTVAGIEVLFVDYGNSCTCCNLRELPEDLVMLQPLAQKCSLQKPADLTCWGPEMVRKFNEISADGQTIFHVNKLSTGETALVELLLDGVDLTTLLLPKTEEARVTSFEGLDEIILDGFEGKYKLESLPDVVWNEESVKKFSDLNDGGKTLFQVEFVSEDTIRLYRGLDDVRFDLNGTKTPNASPAKTRMDATSEIHSPDDSTDDVNNLANGLVQADNEKYMEEIVMDIVDNLETSDDNERNVVNDESTAVKNIIVSADDNTNVSKESTDVSSEKIVLVSEAKTTEVICDDDSTTGPGEKSTDLIDKKNISVSTDDNTDATNKETEGNTLEGASRETVANVEKSIDANNERNVPVSSEDTSNVEKHSRAEECSNQSIESEKKTTEINQESTSESQSENVCIAENKTETNATGASF